MQLLRLKPPACLDGSLPPCNNYNSHLSLPPTDRVCRISSNSYGERAAARLVREVLRTVAQVGWRGRGWGGVGGGGGSWCLHGGLGGAGTRVAYICAAAAQANGRVHATTQPLQCHSRGIVTRDINGRFNQSTNRMTNEYH